MIESKIFSPTMFTLGLFLLIKAIRFFAHSMRGAFEKDFRRTDHPETAKRRGRQHPKGDNSAARLEGTKYQRTDRSLSGHTFE